MSIGMIEPEQLAKNIGLIYVTDEEKGLGRKRCGRGFYYVHPDGQRVRDPKILDRIRSLVIPPAWEEVWICLNPRGHIQATGRDDKGRKQYIYHERWSETANLVKFEGLGKFVQSLPRIRKVVSQQLTSPQMDCEKLLALMVAILDRTGMRIGNEEYAEENGSFGLTTLRKNHLRVNGTKVEFRYRGKSGQKQLITLHDRGLIPLVKACHQTTGRFLFQYENEQGICPITSEEVNSYLQHIGGDYITAKDFRTWKGTVLAADKLYENREVEDDRERKQITVSAVQEVANYLGNTPAVCRNYYIHPLLLDSFLDGQFQKISDSFQPRRLKWLSREEQFVQHFLKAG